MIKWVIIGVFLLILGSLASALIYMIKDPSDSKRTVRALTWRIGLSLLAFALLMLSAEMGWIQPRGPQP